MSVDKFKITGVEETQLLLKSIAPKHAANLNRNVNLALAAQIGRKIRKLAPEDEGDIKKSVKWRRKKSPADKPVSIVYASKIKKGYTPFWWRFQEHGRGGENPQPGKNFVSRSTEIIMSNIDSIYKKQFKKKLSEMVEREKKKLSKK